MGLITEEVEVKWQRATCTHYKNLGYQFTKIGNIFKIKVEHLLNSSKVKVNVKCDCCGEELKNIQWGNYKKSIEKDEKYYCRKCASPQRIKNGQLTKLKNGKSFEEWIIDNNIQNVLDRWDFELNNNCKPNEINYGTKKKYYFKCPKGLHKSELKSINNFTNGYEGGMICNQCNSFAQWGLDNLGEDFLEKYWDWDKNNDLDINPWIISKSTDKPRVYIKCQNINKPYHGSYDVMPSVFTRGHRCPYCNSRKKVHPLDSLGKLLEDKGLLHLWSNKNKKSSYLYAPWGSQQVYWECPDGLHEDYFRSICNSNDANFRCPECKCSKGEEVISNYFINKGLIKITDEDYKILDNVFKLQYKYYIPQKKFDGLLGLGNGQLSYDFHIPYYNFLIEYDGEFHYIPIKKYKNEPIKFAEERLKKQQIHDQLKNKYCQNNNIKLLRIPYWEFDNIENILDNYFKNINIMNY